VAYYCPEPLSEAVQTLLARDSGPAISWLTELELLSALSKKVRAKELSRDDASRIAVLFRSHVSEGRYIVLPVGGTDFEQAAHVVAAFDNALRALDALHLAVARRESLVLATADRVLAGAAKRLDLKVTFVQ
jgi:predicted nucleic acid-binding protein